MKAKEYPFAEAVAKALESPNGGEIWCNFGGKFATVRKGSHTIFHQPLHKNQILSSEHYTVRPLSFDWATALEELCAGREVKDSEDNIIRPCIGVRNKTGGCFTIPISQLKTEQFYKIEEQ
jgi:hypothetical protein